MAGPASHGSIARLVLAASLTATMLVGVGAAPSGTVSALSRWTGGIDLYRTGVFTTQKTWLWCTAADVQIMRNIADHRADHTRSSQQTYFDYMRAHDRYRIPLKDGVDPAGWTAGLRHFVDSRYRLYASGSFDSALRSAVTNLRKTILPVGITVSHGNHAWVLTGFTATADPAATTRFRVTSVRVVGPLWGLQSRTYGYDMRPDTKLTPSQLRSFFTPWHYTSVPMAWEGRWVSVQPVAVMKSSPTPVRTAAPTIRSTPAPSHTLSAEPSSTLASPSELPATLVSPLSLESSATPSAADLALADPAASVAGGDIAPTAPASSTSAADSWALSLIAATALALIVFAGLLVRARRRPH
jgi:hypothetical protein